MQSTNGLTMLLNEWQANGALMQSEHGAKNDL
jgi:hypothetical protein